MKFGTTIALCAATAIGTAYALDKLTFGEVRESAIDMLRSKGIINDIDDKDDICTLEEDEDDDDYFKINKFENDLDHDIIVFYKNDSDEPSVVTMPYEDAVNIRDILSNAIDKFSADLDDLSSFGVGINSFNRLNEALDLDEDDDKDAEGINDKVREILTSKPNTSEDLGDPSKLDPESSNYDITDKSDF